MAHNVTACLGEVARDGSEVGIDAWRQAAKSRENIVEGGGRRRNKDPPGRDGKGPPSSDRMKDKSEPIPRWGSERDQ